MSQVKYGDTISFTIPSGIVGSDTHPILGSSQSGSLVATYGTSG